MSQSTPVLRQPWLDHYDPGTERHLGYDNLPLYSFLDQAAEKYPKRVAITFKNNRVTYEKLRQQAEVMAHNLHAQGVRPGDRVAVMLPNLPQTIAAFWAVLKTGAVVVMTNPLYMEKELVHQLRDSGAKYMILLDLLWNKVEPLRDRLPVEKYFVTTMGDGLKLPLSLLAKFKLKREGRWVEVPYDNQVVIPYRTLLKGRQRLEGAVQNPKKDLAVLQYTGGTTGTSKGAMLTHRNLFANTHQLLAVLTDFALQEHTFLAILPYFHVYGLTVTLILATALAANQAPFPRFVPREVLESLGKIRPTVFPGAPSVYISLMQQKDVGNYDLRSIKLCISGSAPLPVESMKRFRELTGAQIVEGYGLTEASPVTHLNPIKGTKKPGSIGIPFPDTDARIVDMEVGSVPLPPGKVGELIIRGPQVMLGYWQRPDESAGALRNNWLYTGDIAQMDEDGYFYIVDRKKDMIITGGYNVYPREIDEVLYEHPKIKEAVTLGVPHKSRGEVIKACVVPMEGAELTKQEVVEHCRARLANYKVPKLVEFRDELPKTYVGKILRRVIREEDARHQPETMGQEADIVEDAPERDQEKE